VNQLVLFSSNAWKIEYCALSIGSRQMTTKLTALTGQVRMVAHRLLCWCLVSSRQIGGISMANVECGRESALESDPWSYMVDVNE
jgi:hypothetical protein